MNTPIRRNDISRIVLTCDALDILALFGICVALAVAFYYQLALGELPCPLCLLQRIGLILVGLGLAMNVKYGARGMHYGFVILSALITGMMAGRQVLLHIVPGSSGYGSTLLGLHFYTWCVIAAVLILMFVAVLISIRGAGEGADTGARSMRTNVWGMIAIGVFAFLIFANLVSTVLQCGIGQCASNPVKYDILIK